MESSARTRTTRRARSWISRRTGAARSPRRPSARRRSGVGWRARLEIAVLTGPALIVFFAFVIFPVLMAAYYGFYSWKGYGVPTNFVGFKN